MSLLLIALIIALILVIVGVSIKKISFLVGVVLAIIVIALLLGAYGTKLIK